MDAHDSTTTSRLWAREPPCFTTNLCMTSVPLQARDIELNLEQVCNSDADDYT